LRGGTLRRGIGLIGGRGLCGDQGGDESGLKLWCPFARLHQHGADSKDVFDQMLNTRDSHFDEFEDSGQGGNDGG